MAGTMICPDCGRETQYSTRKPERCPDCAKKRRQLINNANDKELFRQHKAMKAIFRQSKEEPTGFAKERAKRDAEIDARSRKQIKKQCQFCQYRWYDFANEITKGCDFVSHTGKLRDRGNGPGDCRSFVPLATETQEERMARRQKALRVVEANNARNTGEKMRDVNLL